MKKLTCLVMIVVLSWAYCCTVIAEGCDSGRHELVYDWGGEDSYTYTDKGDYHEKHTWWPRICSKCGGKFKEESPYITVEGHNLLLHSYSYVHDYTAGGGHEYQFKCGDCHHLIVFIGKCDGPPCEIYYNPAAIQFLDKE